MTLDFSRPQGLVARALLGATIVSRVGGEVVAVRLTEVEAYGAEDDAGSHAFRGRTRRNGSMYQVGGTVYVYSIYGVHELLNLVTGGPGQASAVLVRSGAVVEGENIALARRGLVEAGAGLARGPGNLAVCLGVTRALDGIVLGPQAPLDVVPAPSRRVGRAASAGAAGGAARRRPAGGYWI